MRWGFRWRVEAPEELRREYALLTQGSAPLLVCANHLTMLDSFLIAWALAPPHWYVTHFAKLPWNAPDRVNFTSSWWSRALVWLMKCVPVPRGGSRKEVGLALRRLTHLASEGDVVLLFPEGGRSRSGHVNTEAVTYGVGRLVKALPGCRVLCIHLRGAGQLSWSARPAIGERFRVRAACIEPKASHRGMRGSVEITREILSRIAALEAEAA